MYINFFSNIKELIKKFKKNKRAYYSLIIFSVIFIISLLAELIANNTPLIVKYKNKLYFPIIKEYTDLTFGGDFPTPVDWSDNYILNNIKSNGYIIQTLIPHSYKSIDFNLGKPTPSAPDKNHWLGTDDEGRDVLARILYGIRLSVIFAFILTLISSVIGIFAGAIQGYFGGKTDLWTQRLIEIWESLPQLFILIIISSIFAPGFWTILFILLLFSWTSLTSVVRAEFLRVRNFEFVKAAKVLGVSNFKIMFRHILPNALISAITFIPFIMAEAITALASLDFLGLGLGHEYPSLGDLVRQGKENLQAPWIGISIFVVLSSLLSMLIFIGEGIRDVFDTRKKSL